MSEFAMDFYEQTSGVEFTLRWRDEREFLLGQAFLKELLGDGFSVGSQEPGKNPFYYLENRQLLDTLLEFRQKMRAGAEPGN